MTTSHPTQERAKRHALTRAERRSRATVRRAIPTARVVFSEELKQKARAASTWTVDRSPQSDTHKGVIMFIAHCKGRPEQNSSVERTTSPIFTTINTFKELMDYLNHAPEAQRTEILLADFSARVAAFEDEGVWLGVRQDHYKMIEAILLLRPYGISFSTRKRFDGKLLIKARAKEVKTPEQKDDDFVFSLSRLDVRHTPALGVAA
jgi:hypothetical protein